MLIPKLLKVITTLSTTASQHNNQALQPKDNSTVSASNKDWAGDSAVLSNGQSQTLSVGLGPRSPDPEPTLYTSYVSNGQSNAWASAPPAGAGGSPPPQTAIPAPAPAATTAWPQQPQQGTGPPVPAAQASVPGPPAAVQTGAPGAGGPPAAAAGGEPAGGPPGGPHPVVVGGIATIVLSPDKTVIVENPGITVGPHGADGTDPSAWTNVPPGWYATSYYNCGGQSCAWHVVVRPNAGGGSSNRVPLIRGATNGGRHMGQLLRLIWAMVVYGLISTVVVMVVR